MHTYTGMTDENYGRRMELKVYKLFHVEYINFSYRASIPIICYSLPRPDPRYLLQHTYDCPILLH